MIKNALSFLWEIGKIVTIALVIVVGLRAFVFQPFLVRGASMEPNFHNWDYLIVDEISYRWRSPERGEVIVFKYPRDASQRYIKRIIGLPGETIEVNDGKVTVLRGSEKVALDESDYLSVSDTPGSVTVTLEANEYFVLGDNRLASSDSRVWGVLPRRNIVGRAFLRAFPVRRIRHFKTPNFPGVSFGLPHQSWDFTRINYAFF